MAGRRLRLLHLVDRGTERGGAYVHLSAILRRLALRHDLLLAVGLADTRTSWPAAVIPGLAARGPMPVAAALDALEREFRPDLVHVHTVVNPQALAWAAARPAVMTLQDHRYFCPGRGKLTATGGVCREAWSASTCAPCFDDRAYMDTLLALVRQRLDALAGFRRLITLSHYMRNELLQAGLAPERLEVIPPFTEPPEVVPPLEALPECVLFVGRLVEAKGLRAALSAWRASGIELPLVFAGTGPLRTELELQGLRVLGWLGRRELSAAFGRARAVLMPSLWQEPFGLTGLEALAHGVPVAAWDSGGIREWHPGPPGLAAWGDTAGLALALRAVCGTRARAPQGFEPEPLMARLEALYATACG